MRGFAFLLMQMPPNNQGRFGPEPGRTTQPMPSPYRGQNAGTPPPPPPPQAPYPSEEHYFEPAYSLPHVTIPPVRKSHRGRNVFAGMLTGIVLVALGGVGLALSQGGLTVPKAPATTGGTTSAQQPPTATTASATATAAPATPTLAPPQSLAAPQPGFTQYTTPVWGIDYPTSGQPSDSSISTPIGTVPTTTFRFDDQTQFLVGTLPLQVPDSQAQSVLNAIASAINATDVQILDQEDGVQLGQNSWSELHVRATVAGQRLEARLYYSTFGNEAVAISASAPIHEFTAIDQSAFQPMIQSFAYLQ
jgi:hypothetical protein